MATMFTSTNTSTRTPSEISRALANRAEGISVALLGEPTSQSRRQYRWGKRRSVWLGLAGANRGRWYDHEHGEGGDLLDLIARQHGVRPGEAITIAERDYLGGTSASPLPRRPEPPRSTDDSGARTRAALRIWHQATPIVGTLAERYFSEYRMLDIMRLGELGHCLRWHVGIRAIVALMTDPVSNDATGIHRTFLDVNGAKLERKMLGCQGIVRLSPNSEVTMGLGITEGLEDGLAVLLSGWAPVWAATSAGAISRFPTLPGIEALTIFADADAPGMRAAHACAAKWCAAGVEVRVARPNSRGTAHVR
jgi:hypothetical protein